MKEFATFRSGGQFVPVGLNKETVVFPCFLGGAEWGGPAVDRTRGVIYVNANEAACVLALTENKPTASTGERIYHNQCSLCHGKDLAGTPPLYPSLVDVGKRLSPQQIAAKIAQGGGRMPSFPNLRDAHLQALIQFLTRKTDASDPDQGAIYSSAADGAIMKYEVTGSRDFLDAEGYPAITPPWGTLNAIDLNTGRYLWKIPLGEYPELVGERHDQHGLRKLWRPDRHRRRSPVHRRDGMLTRNSERSTARPASCFGNRCCPFAGTATPATYMAGGKQYVVIASGGSQFAKGPSGSAYVAFRLP